MYKSMYLHFFDIAVTEKYPYNSKFAWSCRAAHIWSHIWMKTLQMIKSMNPDILPGLLNWGFCGAACKTNSDRALPRNANTKSTQKNYNLHYNEVLYFLCKFESHLGQHNLNYRIVFFPQSRGQMAAHQASLVFRRYRWLQKHHPCCRMWRRRSGPYRNQRGKIILWINTE